MLGTVKGARDGKICCGERVAHWSRYTSINWVEKDVQGRTRILGAYPLKLSKDLISIDSQRHFKEIYLSPAAWN